MRGNKDNTQRTADAGASCTLCPCTPYLSKYAYNYSSLPCLCSHSHLPDLTVTRMRLVTFNRYVVWQSPSYAHQPRNPFFLEREKLSGFFRVYLARKGVSILLPSLARCSWWPIDVCSRTLNSWVNGPRLRGVGDRKRSEILPASAVIFLKQHPGAVRSVGWFLHRETRLAAWQHRKPLVGGQQGAEVSSSSHRMWALAVHLAGRHLRVSICCVSVFVLQ